jgi:hypothetical protein
LVLGHWVFESRINQPKLETICGQQIENCQVEAYAKVRDAIQTAMQDLRASAGRLPQVRHLPDLFSQISRSGFDPWRAQGQLVRD